MTEFGLLAQLPLVTDTTVLTFLGIYDYYLSKSRTSVLVVVSLSQSIRKPTLAVQDRGYFASESSEVGVFLIHSSTEK